MKKKLFVLTALLSAMLWSTVSYGAEIAVDECEIAPDTGKLTVQGRLTDYKKGQRVTFRMLKPNQQLSDWTPETSEAVFHNLLQTAVDGEGNFEFSFTMSGEPDYYTVVLYTDGLEENWTKKIGYVKENDVRDAVAMLNSAQCATKAGLYDYLSQPSTQFVLSMDMVFLNSVSNLERVCGLLTEEKNTYADEKDFREKLKAAAVLDAVNQAQTGAQVEALLAAYHQELLLDKLPRYQPYAQKAAVRAAVCGMIAQKEFTSSQKFGIYFEEQVVLKQLAKMGIYSEVPSWMEENNDILDLDLSRYNSLEDKAPVQRTIAGKDFTTVEALRTAFHRAVEDQYDKENRPKKGGSSGGGSGGGFSAGVPAPPNLTGQEEAKPQVKDPPAVQPVFDDLDSVDWAKESIVFLKEKKVLSGDGTGKFYPNNRVTREEFVKMIVTAFGLEGGKEAISFGDTDPNAWYAPYIASAVQAGIIQGDAAGNFGIGAPVTRQDMAVILERTAAAAGKELPQSREPKAFSDSGQISAYAAEAVSVLYCSGVINGVDEEHFAPEQSATRAEAAKMLYGVYTLLQ